MRYFLDAHTFIWWDTEGERSRLSAKVFGLLSDRNNSLSLSLATVWEIQIKVQLGKLTLAASLPQIIERQRQVNRIELFPINLAHILALSTLPSHHGDPFDRLLIAQAAVEGIAILSKDAVLTQYPVNVIW